jgi:signal transduction histidine kinase
MWESQQASFEVRVFVHDLRQQTTALERWIREWIKGVGQDDALAAAARRVVGRTETSLYREFDWKIAEGVLNEGSLTALLTRLLREVDLYHILVENLSAYFERENRVKLSLRDILLDEILSDVIDLFSYKAAVKQVEFRLEVTGYPTVKADGALLRRMIVNLVDNAVKYSFEGTGASGQRYIDVRCWRYSARGDVCIELSNYGVGVLPDEIRTGVIFEYGTRGTLASDRNREGTGVGLSEARRIASAHGGSATLASKEIGGGIYLTTVTVFLPPSPPPSVA